MAFLLVLVIVGCVLWASRRASSGPPAVARAADPPVDPPHVEVARPGRRAHARPEMRRPRTWAYEERALTEDDLIAFGLALEAVDDVVAALLRDGVGPAVPTASERTPSG
jgi:hypothetical protein